MHIGRFLPILSAVVLLLITTCACSTKSGLLIDTISRPVDDVERAARPNKEIFEEYQFWVNSDDTITITKYLGSQLFVRIPTEIDGKAVVTIGKGAFQDCSTITNITISEGVRKIQDNAFANCEDLMTITIPASVTQFGIGLFADCANLESIYFEGDAPDVDENMFGISPSHLTVYHHESSTGWSSPWHTYSTKTYGDYLYQSNGIGTITITRYVGIGGDIQIPSEIDGKAVTAIGNTYMENGAFQGNSTITSVTIPEGVTEIQDNAFQSCLNLESIQIPASVALLRNCAFDNCPSLHSIYFEGDAPQTGNFVISAISDVTIYCHEETTGWSNPWYSCPIQTY